MRLENTTPSNELKIAIYKTTSVPLDPHTFRVEEQCVAKYVDLSRCGIYVGKDEQVLIVK